MDYEKMLAELQGKLAAVGEANEAILATMQAENRETMTVEESAAFDDRLEAFKSFKAQIERVKAQQAAADVVKAGTGRRTDPNPIRQDPIPAATAGLTPITATRLPASVAGPAPRYYTGPDARQRAYRDGRVLHAQLYGRSGESSVRWCREHGIDVQALTESAPPGSVVVHPEFSQIIIDLREQFGVIRRMAGKQIMPRETWSGTVQTAGITAYPVGEATAGTASEPSWSPLNLTAKTWQTETRYSRELSDDAFINLPEKIARECAIAFAVAEDNAGFLGDGTSTYHGIQGVIPKIQTATYASSVVTATTGNTAFSTLDLVDFESCMGVLSDLPGINPAWYISKPGWAASMMRLVDAAGGNTAQVIEGRRVQEFLGYPVIFVSGMLRALTAQVGQTAALLGDLAMAVMLGDRAGFELNSDPFTAMDTREIKVYGTERFDINVHSLGQTREGIWVTPMVALEMAAS